MSRDMASNFSEANSLSLASYLPPHGSLLRGHALSFRFFERQGWSTVGTSRSRIATPRWRLRLQYRSNGIPLKPCGRPLHPAFDHVLSYPSLRHPTSRGLTKTLAFDSSFLDVRRRYTVIHRLSCLIRDPSLEESFADRIS